MRRIIMMMLLLPVLSLAQMPCDFSVKVTDSIGNYRATKNYLVYERNFGGNSDYIYFSLALTDEVPTLNMQLINKSRGFIKAQCFDKNSRMYLQLTNGKIISLIHMDAEDCGTSLRTDNGINNRLLSGYFLFPKGSLEELEKSPITLLRLKFSTETVDYIVKETLVSEMDGKTYAPERFFIDSLHCLRGS